MPTIRPVLVLLTLVTGAISSPVAAQKVDPSLYSSLEWRMIGPFRAGRTIGATGVRGQPNVFYVGVNNGGVWKTTDYGRVWTPIFDAQPTGSIGDLAVAPSNPSVIYVGTGEGVQRPDLSTGDGIYKSTDAGKTWRHLGLRDGQQIGGVIVDPRDENRIFVAVLGHPYGPNPERGVYRSTNGGETFERVLYKDENTRRNSGRIRSDQSPDRLRSSLGGPAGTMGECGVERTAQWTLQVNRWRHYVASVDRRASDHGSRFGEDRIHHRTQRSAANVRHGRRSDPRRDLSFRRRG